MSKAWRKWVPISLLTSLAAALTFWSAPADAGKPKPPPPPPPPPIVAPYSITFLGTLGGTHISTPFGMNSHGDVVGLADTGIVDPDSGGTWWNAFLNIDDGHGGRKMIDLQELFEDEGLVPPFDYETGIGWHFGLASDINDNGQIVGEVYYYSPPGYAKWVYRYTPGSTDENGDPVPPKLLRSVGWGNLSSTAAGLQAINGSGELAGTALYSGDELRRHAVLFVSRITDLGQMNGKSTTALDLNDSGQLCGYISGIAWRYTPGTGFKDLGTLQKNATCKASAINNSGQVTGTCTLSTGYPRAFRYTDGAGMKDLGTLGGNSCLYGGESIDDFGDVVGRSQNGGGWYRLFLYTDKLGMIDLESQIVNRAVPAKDGILRSPLVNNSGQVCGTSDDLGAWLLTPVLPLPR